MNEWNFEPNYLSFTNNNLKCEIIRHEWGHLNAYIYVPENNIYFGLDELTLNELLKPIKEISYAEENNGLWKIGISFSNISDFVPNISEDNTPEFIKMFERFLGHQPATMKDYKNIEFAIDQIKKISDSMK